MQKEKDIIIEIKKEILRTHLDTLRGIINYKFNILSIISGLSATFLVIATFNEALFAITPLVKILITTLLALIPLSLFFLLLELHMGEESVLKGIDKITGLDSKKLMKEKREAQGIFWMMVNTIVAYSPFFIFAIFSFIVIIIICLIFI